MPIARHRFGGPGFTLIELLTVLAVIAILGAMTVGAMRGVQQRANLARAKAELAVLATALEDFRRQYGDYPQLGGFAQAPLTPDHREAGPGLATAQAKLFNCLTGVFGARAFASADQLRGPNLLEIGKLSLNGAISREFRVPASHPWGQSFNLEQDVAVLDPWGRRYRYYYKDAGHPGQWQAPGFVLYSAGARIASSGAETPPLHPATGLMLDLAAPDLADNIYANP